jgi:hypothetical protein
MEMVRSHLPCRTDANHKAITEALRQYKRFGVVFRNTHTSDVGDIIAALRGVIGSTRLIEIKDPEKPPSARRLTYNEMELQADFADFRVCLTVDEVLDAIGYDGPRLEI